MKISRLLAIFALLCCAILVFADEPIGEEPTDQDRPDEPTDYHMPPPSEGSSQEEPNDSSSHVSTSSEASDGVICIALALICPDGSTATTNDKCQFICGAKPIGNLSDRQMYWIYNEFTNAYKEFGSVRIGKLNEFPDVVVAAPESSSDSCIVVSLWNTGVSHFGYPDVFNGARVIYTSYTPPPPACSPQVCQDGTLISCNDVCPENSTDGSILFTPISIILVVIVVSSCCCCLRRRRCRAKCQQKKGPTIVVPQTRLDIVSEEHYPAQQYRLLQQQQEQTEIPMHPYMGQPMYPPMPFIPPHMMMQNGAYPIMVQGPNGMWYSVPQQQDA